MRIDFGALGGHFGFQNGNFLSPRSHLGAFWDQVRHRIRFYQTPESHLEHFGSILGQFWFYFDIILEPFWLHLASLWCFFMRVPFWEPFLLLFGRLVDQMGGHFGGIFRYFSYLFFVAFLMFIFGSILSHFGVVFGSFLKTFFQLVGPLRGNVHVSRIDTPLSVLLVF